MNFHRASLVVILTTVFLIGIFNAPSSHAQAQTTVPGTSATTGKTIDILKDCPESQGVTRAKNSEGTAWSYIRCTPGVKTIWRLVLSMVDFIVVAGLVAVAFANIFNFKLDTYAVKQALPGLIVGTILANLSFFVLRFFIELSTIVEQEIGIITAQYIGTTLGGSGVNWYLMREVWQSLANSLISVPGSWQGLLGITGTLAAGVAGLLAITSTGVGWIFIAVVLGLFILIPILLILALVFLLYIRNYVLMVAVMTAPIAFFALGFPPLKKVWQVWWGYFWKWLLMPIVSLSMLGFLAIFLKYSTNSGAETAAKRDFFDYIFFNGLAIFMLWEAIQLPFKWGTIFGVNVVDKWAEYGKLAGRKGYDTVAGTGIGRGVGQLRASRAIKNFDPATGTSTDKDFGKHSRAAMQALGLTGDYNSIRGTANQAKVDAEIRRRYRNDQSSKAISYNPVRNIESVGGIYEGIVAGQKKTEERLRKRTELYGKINPAVNKPGHINDLEERYKKEFQGNDDIDGLKEYLTKLSNTLKAEGFTDDDERAKLIRKLASSNSLISDIMDNPVLNKLNIDDLMKQILATSELRRAYQRLYNRDVARTTYEADLHAYAPAPSGGGSSSPDPYAPSSGGSTDAGSKPSSHVEGSSPVPDPELTNFTNAINQLSEKISSLEPDKAIDSEDRSVISENPAHAFKAYQGTLSKKEQEVKQTLSSTTIPGGAALSTGQVEAVVQGIRRKVASNAKTLGGASEYGLTDEQFKIYEPALKSYFNAGWGLKKVMKATVLDADNLSVPAIIAKSIENQKPKPQDLLQMRQAVEKAYGDLEKPLGTMVHSELLQVKKNIAPFINVNDITDDLDADSMHIKLASRVKYGKLGVQMNQEAQQLNVPVDDVVNLRQKEDLTMKEVAKVLDKQREAAQGGQVSFTQQGPDLTEARQLVKELSQDPVYINKFGQIPSERMDAISETVANDFVKELETKRAEQDTKAVSLVVDPRSSEDFRQVIRNSIGQSIQTELQSAINNATPSAPNVGATEIASPADSVGFAATTGVGGAAGENQIGVQSDITEQNPDLGVAPTPDAPQPPQAPNA